MPKTIVCLANGTWNERALGHDTNVESLCNMLEHDTDRQVAEYADGVGTGVFRLTCGALGVGLSANVRELYHFVAENYEPGDRVALFGFSRAPVTSRSACPVCRGDKSSGCRPRSRGSCPGESCTCGRGGPRRWGRIPRG